MANGDRNVEYDSAIFFEANSFNIGQNVLGLKLYSCQQHSNLLIDNFLPHLNATDLPYRTTFVWKKDVPFHST
jgi:hypothetical protein